MDKLIHTRIHYCYTAIKKVPYKNSSENKGGEFIDYNIDKKCN